MESKTTYTPIACHLYDRYEELAVLKKVIQITYYDHSGKCVTVSNTIIKDFQTSNKEEFLILLDRTKIRLDKIIDIKD